MKKLLLSACLLASLSAREYTAQESAAYIGVHGADFLLNSYIIHKVTKAKLPCSPRIQLITSACAGAALTLGSVVQSSIRAKNRTKKHTWDHPITNPLHENSIVIASKLVSTVGVGSVIRLAGIFAKHPGAFFFGAAGFFLFPPILGIEGHFIKAAIIGSQALYVGLSGTTALKTKNFLPFTEDN